MRTPFPTHRGTGLLTPAAGPAAAARRAATRHAPVAVHVEVWDHRVSLASLTGTLWFDGGRSFHYALTLCRRSSFSPPYVEVCVNGRAGPGIHPGAWAYGAACDRWSAPVAGAHTHPAVVRDVQFVLAASSCAGHVFEEWRSAGGPPNRGPDHGRYANPYR